MKIRKVRDIVSALERKGFHKVKENQRINLYQNGFNNRNRKSTQHFKWNFVS